MPETDDGRRQAPGSRAECRDQITGVILAGGRARRMGGDDKGLIEIGGKSMVEHVIDALKPQVGALLISANRNLSSYRRYGYPVAPDTIGDYFGPLAGMASAMRLAQTSLILTAPCDAPLIPGNLVQRLCTAMETQGAQISVVHDGERIQPVFALLRCSLLDSVTAFLRQGHRRIDRWYAQCETVSADFSDSAEAFLNLNTPGEVTALRKRLRGTQAGTNS